MIIFIIITWLLIGLLTMWREWQSTKKYWWINHKQIPIHLRNNIILYSPIFLLLGPIAFFLLEHLGPLYENRCWYYKIPNQHKLKKSILTQEQFDYWLNYSILFTALIVFVGLLPQSKNFCPYWIYLAITSITNKLLLIYHGLIYQPKDFKSKY